MKISDQKIINDSHVLNLINQSDYASAANYLFNSQLKSWELMNKYYHALKKIQTKSFWFDGFKINVQFNPERIKSTSAAVDNNSISNRDCFLCSKNLPIEQKGILLREDFILLCNPYPIFPQHFTIANVNHKPQEIVKYFVEFLELSKLLSPNYTLIYNGPACGASAPDHLHFQAGTKQFMPIENDIQLMKNDIGMILKEEELISISFIDDGLRRIIFIESIEQSLIENSFRTIFNLYKNISSADTEPMMNLLCNFEKEFGWKLIIFLRSKHRPDVFFMDEPERILISPAAVDLGGVVVTPREEDFLKTDKELIEKIFNEVSLDKKTFHLLAEKIKAELS